MGSKYDDSNKNIVPGPGSYDPSVEKNSNKINCFIMGKFGTDKKIDNIKNHNPAPDTYFQDIK